MKIQNPKSREDKHCWVQAHFQAVVTEATSTDAVTARANVTNREHGSTWMQTLILRDPRAARCTPYKLCNTHTTSSRMNIHTSRKLLKCKMVWVKCVL